VRVRKALVIRPPGDGWAAEHLFDPPHLDRRVLPVELLAFASAVKFASPHRVSMHDAARGGPGGDASRAIAVHRPDAVLIAWHPAARDAARAIAEAARDVKAVVAVVDDRRHAPVAAADGPWIGALDRANTKGLIALMNALGENAADAGVAASLEVGGSLDQPFMTDRKLLDYARYQGSAGARWRAAVRAFRPVGELSGSKLSDKGRFAASSVLLADDIDAVVRDVNECVLLGIPWVDLRGCVSSDLLGELLPRLARLRRETPGLHPDLGGLRLRIDPREGGTLDEEAARGSGIVALDYGLLDAASAQAAIGAAVGAREAGWVTTAEFALGRAGADADADARLLLDLEEAGVAVQGRVMVELDDEDLASPEALTEALEARRRGDARKEAVLRLARDLDARAEAATLVKPGRPSIRRLLRRLLT